MSNAGGTLYREVADLRRAVERTERTARGARRHARKANHRARFTKWSLIIAFLLLVLLIAWVIWAAIQVAEKVGDKLGPLGGLFGISYEGPQRTADAYITAAAQAPQGCHLSPFLLAGIGQVESGHGTSGDAVVQADGTVSKAIRGVRLDGTLPGTDIVWDTDGGALDGDEVYDRAVGVMQALPTSWLRYMSSSDDPQNVDDAATFAARYLCDYHRDLSDPVVQRQAVLAYNNSESYADDVLGWAARFGQASTEEPQAPRGGPTTVGGVMRAQLWSAAGSHLPGRLHSTAQYWLVDNLAPSRPPAPASGGQGERIAAVARSWVGREYNPGVAAQCMAWTRQVLEDSGLTVGVTERPLDGQWTGPNIANSIGSDQGQVIHDPAQLRPGDVVMFSQTYGSWGPGVTTHVAVYVGGGNIVDRPTYSQPVKERSLSTFEHFDGAVRLWPQGTAGRVTV